MAPEMVIEKESKLKKVNKIDQPTPRIDQTTVKPTLANGSLLKKTLETTRPLTALMKEKGSGTHFDEQERSSRDVCYKEIAFC